MSRRLRMWSIAVAAALGLIGLSLPAAAAVSPDVIEWEMAGVDMVRFHVQWHNHDTYPSLGVTGQMSSQEFGAFLPTYGLIGTFVVPPIEPESFFDVYFEVPLSQLPPSPGGSPGGGLVAIEDLAVPGPCPPLTWSGNVDIVWAGPGGAGHVNSHYGVLGLCPGGPASCIHTLTGCNGPLTWAIVNPCQGFTVTLLNEDLTPAPAVLPVGWTGWICVSAAAWVPVGTQCCFTVNFTCGGVTTPVRVCAFACQCPTPAIGTTWGQMKSIYR
jgi:hypothetical protein